MTFRKSSDTHWSAWAVGIALAIALAFGVLYFASWLLWLILAEFDVKVSLWLCMAILFVVSYIGKAIAGK